MSTATPERVSAFHCAERAAAVLQGIEDGKYLAQTMAPIADQWRQLAVAISSHHGMVRPADPPEDNRGRR